MELLAALSIGAGIFGTGIWLAVSRGTALRERDSALFQAAGLADERDIASRKMAAMSKTIIALERLIVEGDGDSRNLLSLLGEHRRMLSEAEDSERAITSELHPRPSAAPASRPPGVRARSEVLDSQPGDADGVVGDPRSALGRRSRELP